MLAFLWIAFTVLSIVAFFAILFTGRYPRAIFDFNVGVLRWSWRVAYYTYGALATDRYRPSRSTRSTTTRRTCRSTTPITSRGDSSSSSGGCSPFPHYLVVALLVGGGVATSNDQWQYVRYSGLVSILVLVAAVILAFTGNYRGRCTTCSSASTAGCCASPPTSG